jgi:hypothetical protein
MNNNSKISASSAQIEESIQLLGQAKTAIGTVPRLAPKDRIRSAKIRRGAHQVVPRIATVAAKYAIVAPGVSGDALHAALAQVQLLDALLGASLDSHATISDAHFVASGAMWQAARTLYGMLKTVALTNASVATELKPVEEWFRQRKAPATETSAHATDAETAPER